MTWLGNAEVGDRVNEGLATAGYTIDDPGVKVIPLAKKARATASIKTGFRVILIQPNPQFSNGVLITPAWVLSCKLNAQRNWVDSAELVEGLLKVIRDN